MRFVISSPKQVDSTQHRKSEVKVVSLRKSKLSFVPVVLFPDAHLSVAHFLIEGCLILN